jgi:lipid II:glycine glycyltransferase (peptidoglycan interpeptide bridge formation enzyme)
VREIVVDGSDRESIHWWDATISSFGQPHLLQTWEWGQVKACFGWSPFYMIWPRNGGCLTLGEGEPSPNLDGSPAAAALVLERTIPLRGFAARLRIHYVPKGPLLQDWTDTGLRRRVLDALKDIGTRRDAIFIKIDPDVPLDKGDHGLQNGSHPTAGLDMIRDLETCGWRFSDEQVQFRNTVLVDLTGDEERLLERMKQKTRYNIRLSARKGVAIRQGTQADIPLLYRMYAETSVRDGFVIRDERYYQALWGAFIGEDRPPRADQTSSGGSAQPYAMPLMAEVAGEPVAALILFVFASRAWYLFGMSREAHREKMPNYLLQWEAMRLAKRQGCKLYDLWGAPDDFNETDPLWGVYRFKEGLGGEVERHIGAWDLPLKPLYYKLYTQILPRFLNVIRRRGKERTRQIVGA